MNTVRLPNCIVTRFVNGFLFALTVFVLSLQIPHALAGAHYQGEGDVRVHINNDGSGNARGLLSMVYNSEIENGEGQYIGCQTYSGGRLFCISRDRVGLHGSCSGNSEFLSESVVLLMPDSLLNFSWDQNGVCTNILVYTGSLSEGKNR